MEACRASLRGRVITFPGALERHRRQEWMNVLVSSSMPLHQKFPARVLLDVLPPLWPAIPVCNAIRMRSRSNESSFGTQ